MPNNKQIFEIACVVHVPRQFTNRIFPLDPRTGSQLERLNL